MRVAKTLQKLLLVPAVPDVIANVIRVLEGEDHEVMAFAVAKRA